MPRHPNAAKAPTADALPAVTPAAPDAPPSAAELQAIIAQQAALIESLKTTTVEALSRKTPAPDAPVKNLPTRKLLFVGERYDEALKMQVPDLMSHPVFGASHTCGRGSSPVTFASSDEDSRPHAYVTESFGDWLIAEDCPKDAYGRSLVARYRWAE